MRRVSGLRFVVIALPLLSILCGSTMLAADLTKERGSFPLKIKRLVLKVMEQIGIPPGKTP